MQMELGNSQIVIILFLFKADAALYCSVCFFVVLKECISASLDWHCMWYSYSKLVDMQI